MGARIRRDSGLHFGTQTASRVFVRVERGCPPPGPSTRTFFLSSLLAQLDAPASATDLPVNSAGESAHLPVRVGVGERNQLCEPGRGENCELWPSVSCGLTSPARPIHRLAAALPNSSARRVAAMTASITVARSPPRSSACRPAAVVPPGLVTWSLGVAGCSPV